MIAKSPPDAGTPWSYRVTLTINIIFAARSMVLAAVVMLPLLVVVAAAQTRVSPTPRPARSEGVATMLDNELKSLGRVSWSQTTHNTQTGETKGPDPKWEEVASVSIDARRCEMKVQWNSSDQGPSGGTFYFEALSDPRALATQDYLNNNGSGIDYTVSPAVYSVSITGMGDFKVRDLQTAQQIASGFDRLIPPCSALPPSAAAGTPSLDETMNFIVDKLISQGPVNYVLAIRNTSTGEALQPMTLRFQFSNAVSKPIPCFLSYHTKLTTNGKTTNDNDSMLTFRRIEKVEVMPLNDEIAKEYARMGITNLAGSVTPEIFAISMTFQNGAVISVVFNDHDMANRVAKAMTHAAELCGSGRNEPF
jgi:hypothetical protein